MKNIPEKIKNKTATVLTASEFKARVRSGTTPKLDEVDVVTCGTFGIMSGTSAVLSFPVGIPGSFTHALKMTLNGVPVNIGPCPNERNGHVDCIVFGTAVSETNARYSGGHLFRDLAARALVHARITTDTGVIEKNISVDEMSCARLVVTRGAFKNYTVFVNPGDEPVKTIFSVLPLAPHTTAATFSGCGEINPLENDPQMRHHRPGKQVLVNGAPGILLGTGTRSSEAKPNLSVAANIAEMQPSLMGGFSYPNGAECLTSIATAIPVEDEETLSDLSILDEQIPLPIADVNTRTPFDATTYADAWSGDGRPKSEPENCLTTCKTCAADFCPMQAITPDKRITDQCMGCFACVSSCPAGVFSAKTGTLSSAGGDVPVSLRQSDRLRGERAAEMLKDLILSGTWSEI